MKKGVIAYYNITAFHVILIHDIDHSINDSLYVSFNHTGHAWCDIAYNKDGDPVFNYMDEDYNLNDFMRTDFTV